MKVTFEAKVAIVTGGASGMGAAVARLVVEGGGRVVIADLNEPAGRELAAKLGDSARFMRADVTSLADTQALATFAVDTFGRIDILFNNAGAGSVADITTLELADWHQTINVNLTSAFLVSKAVLPHMKAAHGGSIINVCSVSGMAGDYGMVAYNAAKAGLINMSRSMALDHAKDNIRVNAICPGVIGDTTMTGPLREGPGGLAYWGASIPIRRTGNAIEVARVMAFVASDLASYMTGTVIAVDGGLTSHTGMPVPHGIAPD